MILKGARTGGNPPVGGFRAVFGFYYRITTSQIFGNIDENRSLETLENSLNRWKHQTHTYIYTKSTFPQPGGPRGAGGYIYIYIYTDVHMHIDIHTCTYTYSQISAGPSGQQAVGWSCGF